MKRQTEMSGEKDSKELRDRQQGMKRKTVGVNRKTHKIEEKNSKE